MKKKIALTAFPVFYFQCVWAHFQVKVRYTTLHYTVVCLKCFVNLNKNGIAPRIESVSALASYCKVPPQSYISPHITVLHQPNSALIQYKNNNNPKPASSTGQSLAVAQLYVLQFILSFACVCLQCPCAVSLCVLSGAI